MSFFAHRASLRFALRVTVAALLAFGLTQFFTLPLHGLWAVLTAVVVSQMSVGGSLRATIEYIVGTFGGAFYASLLGIVIPHATPVAMAAVLALAIAPLAYLAARNPNFRVAPFTAVIVLLLAGQFGEGPLSSAIIRLSEVIVGGAVAIAVSLAVLPERAHRLALDAAARTLEKFADALPEILRGFTAQTDTEHIIHLQNEIGDCVTSYQALMNEERGERMIRFSAWPDPGALSRTLLRLRHDLVILGRASVTPLPEKLTKPLEHDIAAAGLSVGKFFRASATALASRKASPEAEAAVGKLGAFADSVARLRQEGATRSLTSTQVEQFFALSFAFEELRLHCEDLARCLDDWARGRQ